MAPSEHHIRVYITVVGGDPSKPWSLPSEGEGESHSPTGNPHQGGGTLHHLQTELGDLADQELCQFMEDLCQEIAFHELHTPQQSITNTLGRTIREQESQWQWPGDHLSERVRVGSPKTTIPICSPSMTRWRVGSSGTTSSTPRPALANPDVGHLISTLTLGLCLGTPKINTFSGKAMPGKAEVSFEQWNHEVQCVKDHYLELVVWESIVRSLKGAVADMAQYMGPTASVSEILQKLAVIFGTVALFNVLMQNFYNVTQGNHEKVSLFATRLEGTLNQIRLKCPGRIVDHKVMWQLKDWLFHGVCKHIRDSIRYLHSNPKITYSQLMVAARQAESEMEDAKEKVSARSYTATEVTDSS